MLIFKGLLTSFLGGVVVAILSATRLFAQSSPAHPYTWRNVVIGGGGFVTGITLHPDERGLMYARTDVGGAYRWDALAKKWAPITDWIGAADDNLFGIEGIALDPRDPSRLYLAAGTYSQRNAAILYSDDQGKSFRRTAVPFKMGGNEAGRFNGPRLAVDPNLGNILFFGSRRDGLWKSVDRAATWDKVKTFPDDSLTSSDSQPVGIISVIFDRSSGKAGAPTPVLFAAVSSNGTNIYASPDAGLTWQAVTNQPIGLRPNHVVRSTDGILYVTYGREPGPNSMTDGAVWKLNPKNGIWTDITPIKPKNAGQPFGYGAVAVDAWHPSTVMVTTFCHWSPHDEIFRSTDGGASWKSLLDDAVWDHSSAPYTASRTPHWMGDIEIDPFNSDEVLFTTGYGIWCCTNATQADAGAPTTWTFLDQGLEETVPLALISPPEGAHLLSGLGDIDGFRHDDSNESPANGTFEGPRFGNTEDLAYAGMKPLVMVRTGTAGRRSSVQAAISEDGGQTWRPLGREPGNSRGAGSIAMSADGKIIVLTPRRGSPWVTANAGATWTACANLTNGFRVIADPVNPSRFYSFDPRKAQVLASTNGAASFGPTGASFASASGGERFGEGRGGVLYAAPGFEGDLWLAFRNRGLYYSTDGGTNFSKLDGVEGVDALGFGKSAREKGPSTLYLAGTVAKLHAIFRSDDAGQNWVRINDDQHQFGYISHVTGDPRIFGRVYCATGGRGVIYGDLGESDTKAP
jgi:photosystem II stability/assembly factor-like uncharacterized protein